MNTKKVMFIAACFCVIVFVIDAIVKAWDAIVKAWKS